MTKCGFSESQMWVAVSYNGIELEISSINNPPRRMFQLHCLDGLAPLHSLLGISTPNTWIGDAESPMPSAGISNGSWKTASNSTYWPLRSPSHYHYQGLFQPDILVIGLAGSLDGHIEVFPVSDLSSDHVPVVFDLPDDGASVYLTTRPTKVNRHKYANHLADRPRPPQNPAESPDQLDQLVLDLNKTPPGSCSQIDQFSIHADVYDEDTCEMDDPLPLVTIHEVHDYIRCLRLKTGLIGNTGIQKPASLGDCHHRDVRVIMIDRPGNDSLFPDNHRQISLTEQFGFRSGHSTVLQLRRVLNLITGAAERKHHLVPKPWTRAYFTTDSVPAAWQDVQAYSQLPSPSDLLRQRCPIRLYDPTTFLRCAQGSVLGLYT
ncbi:hypothetical protein J6590_069591 [Homalodisca vitripennis]|nr:hypothetical protein J6590_069591 [Homalodisca vitripennis]